MKRDALDFARVEDRHLVVHERLERWALWVRDKRPSWGVQPMFRQHRSHAWQWHAPEVRPSVDPIEAHNTEKQVCALPEKHRIVVRWAYVWPWVPVSAVRKEIAATKERVAELLHDSRAILVNRLTV